MHINWTAIQDKAVELLRALVRFDTTNPPGNELQAARYVASELRAAGYEPELLESAAGRGNVTARLPGTGEKRPLLLFGHLDVVPAEPEYWTHPPFEGVIADGCLWGRGVLDMKYTVAAQLATMLALKQADVRCERDILFAATADEEVGGVWGVEWLLANHPDLLDAEYALTELGGFSLTIGDQRYYVCQTGEKGVARYKLRTYGRPGHGSMPHSSSAILRLGQVVSRLGLTPTPLHVSPPVRTAIDQMALLQPSLKGMLSPHTCENALSQLSQEQALLFNAVIRNTVTVTMLTAGYKENVIPGTAEAMLDCRLAPGQSARDVAREIEAISGPDIDIELELVMESPARTSSLDTPLFRAIQRGVSRYDPGAIVLPMLSAVATDGRFLSERGITYYGYCPLRLPEDFAFSELIHSHDERIPVDAFREGVQVLAQTVLDFCREQVS